MATVGQYDVIPRPRQRSVQSRPDEWAVRKGTTVVQTFSNKQQAVQRGKQLAKNQKTILDVFDAAMKTSDRFDYRSEEDKRFASRKANESAMREGLGLGPF